MNYREAAIQVLKDEKKALHYEEITKIAIERNYITPKGKTPHDTISTEISRDIRKNETDSVFLKYGKGVYGLREFEANTPMVEVNISENYAEEHHQDKVL